MKGKVKFFNEQKGFGFIVGEDEEDYFVHISNIDNSEELNQEDAVDFKPSSNDKGKCALNVVKE